MQRSPRLASCTLTARPPLATKEVTTTAASSSCARDRRLGFVMPADRHHRSIRDCWRTPAVTGKTHGGVNVGLSWGLPCIRPSGATGTTLHRGQTKVASSFNDGMAASLHKRCVAGPSDAALGARLHGFLTEACPAHQGHAQSNAFAKAMQYCSSLSLIPTGTLPVAAPRRRRSFIKAQGMGQATREPF